MKNLRVSSPEPLESRIAPASATNINLADLDGSGGFEISSGTLGGGLGTSVAILGDINGDLINDFVVGAPTANGGTGAAYVVFGTKNGFPSTFDPAFLNGVNGFAILGGAAGDQFGASVGSAGDINGDGRADIIVGAPGAKVIATTTTTNGAAYVIYGGTVNFPASVNVSTLNGVNGFKIVGGADGDLFGTAVAGVGDVNGDTLPDVIVGAPGADANGANSGAAYVIYGATGTRPAVLSVNTLNTAGFRLSGVSADDAAGKTVSRAGDVNGDGRADFIIGAPNADPFGGDPTGAAYVVFGRVGAGIPAFPANVDLSTLEGTIGFRIDTTDTEVLFGTAVSAAGDFNGDGFDDLIVTVPGAARFGLNSGGAAVIFGHAAPFPASIGNDEIFGGAALVIFGEAKGDSSGFSAAGGGDVNGDGLADIVIGSPGGLTGAGKVHVVLGTTKTYDNGLVLTKLTSEQGWQLNGEDLQGAAGFSVSIGGDINGDGYADVLVGSPTSGASDNGAAHVVFGTPMVLTNPKTVTFMDEDGDQVTIKLSKGKIGVGDIILEQSGMGAVIKMINLTGNASADGASLTIDVKPPAEQAERGGGLGNGKTNIGIIQALGMNLKKLKVRGDITQLVVGGGDFKKPGISLLQALSLGAGAAQFPGVTPAVAVGNGVKTIKVSGDVMNVDIDVGSSGKGDAARGEITGSKNTLKNILIGGNMSDSEIRARNGLGKMTVKGALKDTTTQVGGAVAAKLGKLLLQGVLQGSVNFDVAGGINSMKMTKDVGDTTLTINGSVKNLIISKGIENSTVRTNGRINILGIGGDVSNSTITSPNGFGTVVVRGDFIASQLLAGYDKDGTPVNADATIGKVTILKSFDASSIAAGAVPGADGVFGTLDDALIGGGDPDVLSKIASVTVKGVTGSIANTDHFGIVAEQVSSVRVGSTKVALEKGPHNDDVLLGETDDVSVREL